MAEILTTDIIDAYAQFENWLCEQPCWLQDAAYRIYHGQPIDQEQIEAYMAMCIAQAKKEKVDYKRLPKNGSRSQTVSSIMSVLNLGGIVGVNAVRLPRAGARICDFGERIASVSARDPSVRQRR